MSRLIDQYQHGVYDALRTVPEARIVEAVGALLDVHRQQGTVFVLCPPEDQAAVDHFTRELAQGIGAGPFGFRLVQLFGSPRDIIAWQNDWAYEDVYAEQMRGVVRRGDVVIAVARRGDSASIRRALEAAKLRAARTIAIVGFAGDSIREVADICLYVHSDRSEHVEDVQMMLEHMLCAALRRALSQTAGEAAER